MNITEVMYLPQSFKNVLRVSSIVSRVDTMGYTQDKMTIQKNDVSMILDSRNSNNTIIMFYLKAKQYCPEVQVAHTNIT